MNAVVIHLCHLGTDPETGALVFVGARRLNLESGILLASMQTYVRPKPEQMDDFAEWTGQNNDIARGTAESLPSSMEALHDLSRFAGDQVLFSHFAGLNAVPILRSQESSHTRKVTLLDSAELARGCVGSGVSLSVRRLGTHLGLLAGNPPPLGPLRYLSLLTQVVIRLWPMRPVDLELSCLHSAMLPSEG